MFGTEIDYSASGMERRIFLNCILYVYNDCLEQFEDAYQSFVDSAAFEMNDSLWKEITLEDTSDITTDSFFDVYDKYFTETDQT